ncbi:MAG: futalosine hydrolase [Thermodesulfovibrionales bacterium]|nr:futalosine hydrolase [Thermodesulfovibrionales bacterium]
MALGVIIPTELEGHQLIRLFDKGHSCFSQGKPFYTGLIKDIPVALTICGVGKSNAAHTTGLLIQQYNPTIIVNLGVAGAYPSTGLNVGDVVIASTERYIDEGLQTYDGRFISMQDLGISLTGQTDELLFKLHIPPKLSSIKKGNFATVSTCTGSYSRGLQVLRDYDCICENMEGAAIAHICHYTNTLFTELRCISNIITDRDGSGIDKKDLFNSAETIQSFFIEHVEAFVI